MTALLCLCISSYALTGHAQGLEVGSLDVRMSDLRMKDVVIDGVTVSQGVVEAVYANRTNVPCSYTLERVSADGAVVLETLESGVVEPGEAKLSSVLTTEAGYYLAKMWNTKRVGLRAQDMTSSF